MGLSGDLVRRIPGFGGELALPISERLYGGVASTTPRGAVRAAQMKLERLSAFGTSDGPRYAIPDMDCPPGFRPTLVKECLTWLPEFECRWLSQVDYECWVKKWHCTYWQEGWQCQSAFRVVG